jgi:uncharacterized protein YlxW (UPF0749 family)
MKYEVREINTGNVLGAYEVKNQSEALEAHLAKYQTVNIKTIEIVPYNTPARLTGMVCYNQLKAIGLSVSNASRLSGVAYARLYAFTKGGRLSDNEILKVKELLNNQQQPTSNEQTSMRKLEKTVRELETRIKALENHHKK